MSTPIYNEDGEVSVEFQLQQNQEWLDKWPNHCPKCKGWGGKTFYEAHPYGSTTADEPMFDVCEELDDIHTCHRCGKDGLDEDGNGPCNFCGWDFDDGLPF